MADSASVAVDETHRECHSYTHVPLDDCFAVDGHMVRSTRSVGWSAHNVLHVCTQQQINFFVASLSTPAAHVQINTHPVFRRGRRGSNFHRNGTDKGGGGVDVGVDEETAEPATVIGATWSPTLLTTSRYPAEARLCVQTTHALILYRVRRHSEQTVTVNCGVGIGLSKHATRTASADNRSADTWLRNTHQSSEDDEIDTGRRRSSRHKHRSRVGASHSSRTCGRRRFDEENDSSLSSSDDSDRKVESASKREEQCKQPGLHRVISYDWAESDLLIVVTDAGVHHYRCRDDTENDEQENEDACVTNGEFSTSGASVRCLPPPTLFLGDDAVFCASLVLCSSDDVREERQRIWQRWCCARQSNMDRSRSTDRLMVTKIERATTVEAATTDRYSCLLIVASAGVLRVIVITTRRSILVQYVNTLACTSLSSTSRDTTTSSCTMLSMMSIPSAMCCVEDETRGASVATMTVIVYLAYPTATVRGGVEVCLTSSLLYTPARHPLAGRSDRNKSDSLCGEKRLRQQRVVYSCQGGDSNSSVTRYFESKNRRTSRILVSDEDEHVSEADEMSESVLLPSSVSSADMTPTTMWRWVVVYPARAETMALRGFVTLPLSTLQPANSTLWGEMNVDKSNDRTSRTHVRNDMYINESSIAGNSNVNNDCDSSARIVSSRAMLNTENCGSDDSAPMSLVRTHVVRFAVLGVGLRSVVAFLPHDIDAVVTLLRCPLLAACRGRQHAARHGLPPFAMAGISGVAIHPSASMALVVLQSGQPLRTPLNVWPVCANDKRAFLYHVLCMLDVVPPMDSEPISATSPSTTRTKHQYSSACDGTDRGGRDSSWSCNAVSWRGSKVARESDEEEDMSASDAFMRALWQRQMSYSFFVWERLFPHNGSAPALRLYTEAWRRFTTPPPHVYRPQARTTTPTQAIVATLSPTRSTIPSSDKSIRDEDKATDEDNVREGAKHNNSNTGQGIAGDTAYRTSHSGTVDRWTMSAGYGEVGNFLRSCYRVLRERYGVDVFMRWCVPDGVTLLTGAVQLHRYTSRSSKNNNSGSGTDVSTSIDDIAERMVWWQLLLAIWRRCAWDVTCVYELVLANAVSVIARARGYGAHAHTRSVDTEAAAGRETAESGVQGSHRDRCASHAWDVNLDGAVAYCALYLRAQECMLATTCASPSSYPALASSSSSAYMPSLPFLASWVVSSSWAGALRVFLRRCGVDVKDDGRRGQGFACSVCERAAVAQLTASFRDTSVHAVGQDVTSDAPGARVHPLASGTTKTRAPLSIDISPSRGSEKGSPATPMEQHTTVFSGKTFCPLSLFSPDAVLTRCLGCGMYDFAAGALCRVCGGLLQ